VSNFPDTYNLLNWAEEVSGTVSCPVCFVGIGERCTNPDTPRVGARVKTTCHTPRSDDYIKLKNDLMNMED
jgi:hypothetical protein